MIFIVSHYTAINALALDINKPMLSCDPGSKFPVIPLENCDMVQMRVDPSGLPAQIIIHIKVLEN